MRRLLTGTAVLLAVVLGAACTNPLAPPPGPAPLRYRDQIFSAVTTTTNVVYGSAVNQQGQTVSLVLDVYQPVGDTVSSRPAVVWVHGGGFSGGDKASPEIVDEATTLAKKGFVNVSINYRLSPAGCAAASPVATCVPEIGDAMHDAQAAVRFLRANAATYGVDPGRIGIGGSSAGAITALNVGYNPTDVGTSGNPGYSSAVGAAVSLSGAVLWGSPGPGDAPALLFHGTADPLVPYVWAQNTVTAAQKAGLPVYLITWTGAGHVPYVQNRQQILDTTTNFLYAVLDLAHAAA